ncbi:MAG: GNAT family N-acetyltransferase [Oscillospiraceae bacterium]|nr:GNAT family N-acetyltransferase [Oscillospiraceae bacterium]
MTNKEILRIAMEQHATDANCSPDDFTRNENVVVVSKPNENARRYLNLPFFCDLIYYGDNIVASVDERIYDFVKNYIDAEHPHRCFETPKLHQLTEEFSKYGYLPAFQAEYWLPDIDILNTLKNRQSAGAGFMPAWQNRSDMAGRHKAVPCEMRIIEKSGFDGLYLPEWGNALCEKRKHLDVLAIGAYENDNDKLIGLAGCSADCETMWQIGIDVLPGYRRQGVAAALTSYLAIEIINRGKAPFYCCAWSNIGSARNAIKSGFRPAWAELTAVKAEEAMKWNT